MTSGEFQATVLRKRDLKDTLSLESVEDSGVSALAKYSTIAEHEMARKMDVLKKTSSHLTENNDYSTTYKFDDQMRWYDER
ncbi:hypothetical protein MMC28_000572 [Mycoblastus sanguinarius]|nr:hypothetical protein [Mycoblastus sanguinarius]